MPSPQALALDGVMGIRCRKQQNRALNPQIHTELSSGA